jgi:hypothetical protein
MAVHVTEPAFALARRLLKDKPVVVDVRIAAQRSGAEIWSGTVTELADRIPGAGKRCRARALNHMLLNGGLP